MRKTFGTAIRYLSTTLPAGALLEHREKTLGYRLPSRIRIAVKAPVGGVGSALAQLILDGGRSDLTGHQRANRVLTATLVGAGSIAAGEAAAAVAIGFGASAIAVGGASFVVGGLVAYFAYKGIDRLTDKFPAIRRLLGDWEC
ncbi:MAG: hypothetical protein R2731_14455 [Nocardioides sp.]